MPRGSHRSEARVIFCTVLGACPAASDLVRAVPPPSGSIPHSVHTRVRTPLPAWVFFRLSIIYYVHLGRLWAIHWSPFPLRRPGSFFARVVCLVWHLVLSRPVLLRASGLGYLTRYVFVAHRWIRVLSYVLVSYMVHVSRPCIGYCSSYK